MKIQKAAIIGAGAVGGFFIHGFDGSDVDYCLIAEGSRKIRLEREGIRINEKHIFPRVFTPSEAGPQDLVIIATKYAALQDAIGLSSQIMGENTIVLSVLNGVDSEEKVAAALGKDHVLHSLMKIISHRYSDRIEFIFVPDGGVFYGNCFMPEDKGKEAVAAVTEMFDRTTVDHAASPNILEELWFKYAGNVSSNLPQAVVGCGNGIYLDSEHAEFIRDRLWREAAALARAYNITIPFTSKPWAYSKSARFSTLQDLDAGRPSEIEMLAGTLVKKSKEMGLEAPFAEYTYHIIKLLEEKNSGKFNYSE